MSERTAKHIDSSLRIILMLFQKIHYNILCLVFYVNCFLFILIYIIYIHSYYIYFNLQLFATHSDHSFYDNDIPAGCLYTSIQGYARFGSVSIIFILYYILSQFKLI